MKYKSNKLARLEKNRYSILTEDLTHCYSCGKPASDIHEVFGGRNRQQSMRYGFCVPLCRNCHMLIERDVNLDFEMKLKMQLFFEKTHTRDEFLKIIGRNYEL